LEPITSTYNNGLPSFPLFTISKEFAWNEM